MVAIVLCFSHSRYYMREGDMMKNNEITYKIIAVLISITFVFTGCGVKNDNANPISEQKSDIAIEESEKTPEKPDELSKNELNSEVEESEKLPEKLDELSKRELNSAVERGIITKADFSNLEEPLSVEKYNSMLIALGKNLGVDVEKNQIIEESSTICRSVAASNTIQAFYELVFSKQKDRLDGLINTYGGLSAEDISKINDMKVIHYLQWATVVIDYTSNTKLLDVDANFSIRPMDNMTVKEGAIMMYRLSNYQLPKEEYVEFSDVPNYELSAELLSKAENMPKVTAKEFSFQGMVTDNKECTDRNGSGLLSAWYSQNQAEVLHDMGFNFTRLTNVFVECGNGNVAGLLTSDDGSKVNLTQLQNTDDYIGWCIENGVHVNLSFFFYPPEEDYSNYMESMKEIWRMLALHYKDVPSNVLSFNLINEPAGDDVNVENISLELVSVVKEINPERVIFLDGLNGDETSLWSGASRKPSQSFAKEEGIVQTIHTYTGVFNGDYIVGSGAAGYPSEDVWPFPYVHCVLDEESPITINGEFKQGETVTVRARFTYGEGNTLHVALDGNSIGNMNMEDGILSEQGNSKSFVFKLPSDGQKISITMSGFMQLYDIVIEHEEKTDDWIPYQTGWDFGYYTKKHSDHVITNIQCDWNRDNRAAAQNIYVNEDGTYTADKLVGWPAATVDYGYEGIKEYFNQWEEFKAASGQNYMVQECGFYLWVNTPVALRSHYMDEYLTVLDENHVSWNTIDRAWIYGTRDNSDTKECEWIYLDGFRVNKTYLEIYQKHMI